MLMPVEVPCATRVFHTLPTDEEAMRCQTCVTDTKVIKRSRKGSTSSFQFEKPRAIAMILIRVPGNAGVDEPKHVAGIKAHIALLTSNPLHPSNWSEFKPPWTLVACTSFFFYLVPMSPILVHYAGIVKGNLPIGTIVMRCRQNQL